MNSIEIDDEVYTKIEERAKGFDQTPNAVLRMVFGLAKNQQTTTPSETSAASNLEDFLRSGDYVSTTIADERYLKLISWILRNHVEAQSRLDSYKTRKRVLFSKDATAIERSAKGASVKRILDIDFPFFAMVTLANYSKRDIITRVFTLVGYTRATVEGVIKTLPDSGISRGGSSRSRKTLEDYA